MLVTPVPSTRSVMERLRASSVGHPGLKITVTIGPGATTTDVERIIASCWDARPRGMSPMMLLAVLRHVRSCAIELMALHRHETAGLGCFALVDGSVHEDVWVLLPSDVPTLARVGPRFLLSTLQPSATPEPARADAELIRT